MIMNTGEEGAEYPYLAVYTVSSRKSYNFYRCQKRYPNLYTVFNIDGLTDAKLAWVSWITGNANVVKEPVKKRLFRLREMEESYFPGDLYYHCRQMGEECTIHYPTDSEEE